MDTLAKSLLNKEARRKETVITVQFEANFVENSGRSENHRRNKGRDKSRGRSKSHPKLVCYYCDKPGHANLIVDITREMRRLEKLSQIKLNIRRRQWNYYHSSKRRQGGVLPSRRKLFHSGIW